MWIVVGYSDYGPVMGTRDPDQLRGFQRPWLLAHVSEHVQSMERLEPVD